MALHENFPSSPYEILNPDIRWFPADETLRSTGAEKLLPPLVSALRKEVKAWRDRGYDKASNTSKSLLNWWFNKPHLLPQANGSMHDFQYFFSQRESIETIIYLYDVVSVKDKFDLMRFDVSGAISPNMFDETWLRFVIKMATGAGKTKVMSLVLAWSFFHKLYEVESKLSRNFLLITPNIIVLDRLYKDFQGLKIFFEDPVLPDNSFDGKNWRDDFQLTLHVQDEVRITNPTGNIFLTNIHRVYSGEDFSVSSEDENTMDYFLGKKPIGAITDSKIDLGIIVRDIEELMVINDEAHHIHDNRLAWFTSIQDIHNRLKQKGTQLSLQIDVTATPKHNNGAIFVQTIADYPLVEAISQNVVKHPVLPDAASRTKLTEKQSAKFTEKYSDYIDLGILEWRKSYAEHEKLGKKSILFIMTDDTKNCDDVAEYVESLCPDLKGSVLTIHTNKSGEVSESTSAKNKDDLQILRNLSNEIDNADSPYKVIVSVLMLKEGWDVRNVTTIVGLRAYSSQSNILPEQTLGRGLRKMYPGQIEEYVSVVGTDAFMDFVEQIQAEGVVLERKPMGQGTEAKTPLVVEVDRENLNKDIEKLDIEIPVMTPKVYREYKNLSDLDLAKLSFDKVEYREFSTDEQREIIFKEITTGQITHTTILDSAGIADYRSVIGFFTQAIMRSLRLITGYDILYGKTKSFIQDYLFNIKVDFENPNTLRNLSELIATKTLLETLRKGINELTIKEKGEAEIRDTIKLRNTRPFVVKNQGYLVAKKSVFNRVIGDSHFELQFAAFLENAEDVIAYCKNYFAINFKLDYVNANGDISNYYPDFIVKTKDKRIFVVETKGMIDMDVPLKMARLKQWCDDLNSLQSIVKYGLVYVPMEDFQNHQPQNFSELAMSFKKYI